MDKEDISTSSLYGGKMGKTRNDLTPLNNHPLPSSDLGNVHKLLELEPGNKSQALMFSCLLDPPLEQREIYNSTKFV